MTAVLNALLDMQQSIIDEFPNVSVDIVKSLDGPTLLVEQGHARVYLSLSTELSTPMWALFHKSPRTYMTAGRIFFELQLELNQQRLELQRELNRR